MPTEQFDWSAVIPRCLGYLCLRNSEHTDSPLLEQAAFLEGLGFPASDSAGILGTSSESLRVLRHRARRKKAKKNGKKKALLTEQ
jgi:hypothetical protein